MRSKKGQLTNTQMKNSLKAQGFTNTKKSSLGFQKWVHEDGRTLLVNGIQILK